MELNTAKYNQDWKSEEYMGAVSWKMNNLIELLNFSLLFSHNENLYPYPE